MLRKDLLGKGAGEFVNIIRSIPRVGSSFSIKSHSTEDFPTLAVPVLECRTYHSLVRAVGFYKYRSQGQVYMRGQTRLYSSVAPSMYRRLGIDKADAIMDDFTVGFRKEMAIDGEPKQAASTEALLQHYGIRTRWVDMVDSVPHALFFALRDSLESSQVSGRRTYLPSRSRFGYVTLFEFSADSSRGVNAGVWYDTSGARICDLRQAKPSHALRPHAQHGLLARPADGVADLDDHAAVVLAVPREAAERWIGFAESLSNESLFPDRAWDSVYSTLLGAKAKSYISEFAARRASDGGAEIGEITRFDFHA